MSPNFSWLNFITNALNLASNEPDNPNILLQFLGQLTGQRLARVESNDGGHKEVQWVHNQHANIVGHMHNEVSMACNKEGEEKWKWIRV